MVDHQTGRRLAREPRGGTRGIGCGRARKRSLSGLLTRGNGGSLKRAQGFTLEPLRIVPARLLTA